MSRCCSCTLSQPSVCRTQITSADLAELLYVQGLDVNLCEKFAPIANILQFRDCLGNIISANTQIVTCAAYATQLCDTLATLASGGAVTLGVTQVVGADCQTYVIPETPFVANDTSTIDFTTSGAFGHVLTGVVRISLDAGNIIEVHADGLYVPEPETACAQITGFPAGAPVTLGVTPVVGADCQTHVIPETPVVVVDSTTVDLSNSGTFGHTITADVKISNIAGNTTVVQPDGIYTPATPPTVLGVADTTCVNLSITGAPGSQVITADPIISPTGGNVLECRLNGLYVGVCAHLAALPNVGPAIPGTTLLVGKDCNAYTIPVSPAETPLTVIDTSCINLSTSGVANHTIQADLVISSVPGNIAQCTALGLFVPDTGTDVDIVVVDTPCLNLSVSEAPVGTFTISGTPTISPVPGNLISCTAQGLFVAPSPVTVSAVDTSCINVTVSEPTTNNFTVSAVPTLASAYPGFAAGCNGLQCTASGLAAPPDHEGITFEVGASAPVYSGPISESSVFLIPRVTVTITNTSTCRNMAVNISTRVPEVSQTSTAGAVTNIITAARLYHNFNFPTALPALVTGTILKTAWVLFSAPPDAVPPLGQGNPTASIDNVLILPPGGSGTYFVEGEVEQVETNLNTLTVNGIIVRVTGQTM